MMWGIEVKRRIVWLVLLFCSSSVLQAAPVQWTLTDVLFDDGGTASGSFVFDADTSLYSAIDITTTDGSLVPIATFTSLVAGGSTDAAFVPASGPDQTGQKFLQLVYFQFPLTNAGGTLYLIDPFFPEASSFDGTCANASCSSVTYGRVMQDGGIIGVPVENVVPLPAAAWLLVPSLGLLGALRRRPGRA